MRNCDPRSAAKRGGRVKAEAKVLSGEAGRGLDLCSCWKRERTEKGLTLHLYVGLHTSCSDSLHVSWPQQSSFHRMLARLPLLTLHHRLAVKALFDHPTLSQLHFLTTAQYMPGRTGHLRNVWNSLRATSSVQTSCLWKRGDLQSVN